eukprot:gene7679-8986_t
MEPISQQITLTTLQEVVANGKVAPCIKTASVNLRVSSSYDADSSIGSCSLNYVTARPDVCSSAWCASRNNDSQYIIASCENPRMFTAISTQGRGIDQDTEQWVVSYKLRFSVDNITWYNFNGSERIMANEDRDSIVTYSFDPPIYARSIALHPLAWNNNISMRWELFHLPFDHYPSIQSGTTTIGNRDLNAYSLLGQSNPRTASRQVVFPKPFLATPIITIGIKHLDCKGQIPQFVTRVKVTADNITPTGFTATFSTWSDTTIFDASIDYVAECHSIPPALPDNTISKFSGYQY